MGGSYQVDILRAPGDQIFHGLAKLLAVHGLAHRRTGDGPVLAVAAAQSAAAEEDGTAAAVSCQGRLLPFVDHGLGNQSGVGTAAISGFSLGAVNAAFPGT